MIHEDSQPANQHKLNPADLASRGISTKATLQIQWITEPELLWISERNWPENPDENYDKGVGL